MINAEFQVGYNQHGEWTFVIDGVGRYQIETRGSWHVEHTLLRKGNGRHESNEYSRLCEGQHKLVKVN